jgi:hypothetical protein
VSKVIVLPKFHRDAALPGLMTFIASFLPGKRLKVTVEEAKPPRSNAQNRALWGCAYKALKEQTGNDPEDLHAYFCGDFFGWTEYEVMGMRKKRPARTTTHNESGERDVIRKLEFAEFYNFIQRRAAENGFFVPDPDPTWFEKEDV